MPGALIVNASPLIFLSRVEGLTWLCDLSEEPVQISDAVMAEVAAGHDGHSIITAVEADDRILSVEDIATPMVIAAWDLGAGETQVLAHSLSRSGAIAVLDDAAAKRCGRSLGIPVVGTLGVVLAAKRMGWLPAARPVIETLLAEGLYLSASLVTEALAEVGE